MNTTHDSNRMDTRPLRPFSRRARAFRGALALAALGLVAACSAAPGEDAAATSQASSASDLNVVDSSGTYVPTPATISVEQGDDDFAFSLEADASWAPFTAGLTFSTSTLPAGITIDFQTPTLLPAGAGSVTTFVVWATGGAVPGTYPVTITGMYTGKTTGGCCGGIDGAASTTIDIVVTAAPPPVDAGVHCVTESYACANTCGGIKSNECGGTYDCPSLSGAACCEHLHGRWEATPAPAHCLLE
jgi:hypothetical protein